MSAINACDAVAGQDGRCRRDPRSGLDSADVAERLRHDGPNALPQAERQRIWSLAWCVLREPMLLLAAASIYQLIGDPGDALILGISVLVVRRYPRRGGGRRHRAGR